MATKRWQKQCAEKTRLWLTHVEAWRKSGVSQAEYCRQKGINSHQFGYWKKKFIDKEKHDHSSAFMAIPVPQKSVYPPSQTDSGVTVKVSGITIQLARKFSATAFRRAVIVLQEVAS